VLITSVAIAVYAAVSVREHGGTSWSTVHFRPTPGYAPVAPMVAMTLVTLQEWRDMGIELELHATRPAQCHWKLSRATLLRGSYEHGEELAQVLAKLDPKGSGKLRYVDPYGDTIFNEQEAEAALHDIDNLLQQSSDGQQTAAVNDLAALLRSCAATPGSRLWFIGD
jgi:hypothetical protein